MTSQAFYIYLLLTCLYGASLQECMQEELEECGNSIKKYSKKENEIMIFKTEEDLRLFCFGQQRAVDCLTEHADCIPNHERSLFDSLVLAAQDSQELCNESSSAHKIYVKHMSCFREAADEAAYCETQETQRMENTYQRRSKYSYMSEEDSLKEGCCSADRTLKCILKVIRNGCPKEAADVYEEMFTKLKNRIYRSIQCDRHISDCTPTPRSDGVNFRSCSSRQVLKCVEEVKSYRKNGRAYFEDENDLRSFCFLQQRAWNCIDNLMDRCMSLVRRNVIENIIHGIRDFLEDLCSKNSTTAKGYLKHSSCFKKADEKALFCFLEMDMLDEDDEGYRNTEKMCCLVEQAVECHLTVARNVCPKEAAKLYGKTVSQILDPIFEFAECDSYDYDIEVCSSNNEVIY